MRSIFLAAATLYGFSAVCAAETFTAWPTQDNTLYETPDGSTSNGAGINLFAGVTNTDSIRRALLQFELASIPAGSTVTSATLRITQDRQGPGGAPGLSLHRAIASWGEGTSVGSGGGAPATPSDATWLHRFHSTTLWTTPGGDFDPTAVSTLTASGLSDHTFASSAAFTSLVQQWIASPATNFGFLIKEVTTTTGAAGRFFSREASDPNVRPLLSISFERPASSWSNDADGNWNNPANWQAGVPDAVGVVARFTAVNTAPRTVSNTSPVTVGQIRFDSPNAYTIAGPGQITLDNGIGFSSRIDVAAGHHIVGATIETSRDAILAVAASTSVRLQTFNALATTTKEGDGQVQMAGSYLSTLNLNAGRVEVLSSLATEIGALTFGGGTLDVGRSGAFIPSTAATVAADLAERTAQIVAATIQTDESGLVVGVARSDELGVGSFMGRSLSGPSILLRGTFPGDANIDGAVNFDDLLSLAQKYNTLTGARWIDGDSNRDGKVDFDDLLALAQRYGSFLASSGESRLDADLHQAFAIDWQRALALVPEPALATALAVLIPCGRRRRPVHSHPCE